MMPQHSHESIANKTQAKLFVSDVCLRAADELVGGSFMRNPYDQVVRSQQMMLDSFEEDYSRIGFSATKLRQDQNGKIDSIAYNFWVYLSLYPNPEAIYALKIENDEKIAEYRKDHPEEEVDSVDSVEAYERSYGDILDEIDSDHESKLELVITTLSEGYELKIIEKIDFDINSKLLMPIKQRSYQYSADGSVLGDVEYTQLFPYKWLGDTVEDQLLLKSLAHDYMRTFDNNDIKIMIGILGKLGLASA